MERYGKKENDGVSLFEVRYHGHSRGVWKATIPHVFIGFFRVAPSHDTWSQGGEIAQVTSFSIPVLPLGFLGSNFVSHHDFFPLILRNSHKFASHEYHKLAYSPSSPSWSIFETPIANMCGSPHQHRHGFVLGLGHWDIEWLVTPGGITKWVSKQKYGENKLSRTIIASSMNSCIQPTIIGIEEGRAQFWQLIWFVVNQATGKDVLSLRSTHSDG